MTVTMLMKNTFIAAKNMVRLREQAQCNKHKHQ